jgi:hypothetical protein
LGRKLWSGLMCHRIGKSERLVRAQQWKFEKIKCSWYRPGVAQRVGRGIALLFHDHGNRSMPQLHFTPGKDPVPIAQEAGWAPGPAWTGGKSRPHRDSILDRPACSQLLYWLSYLIILSIIYLIILSILHLN